MSTDDLRARLTALADEWDAERADYPITSDVRAKAAEVAVRLCGNELRALLAATDPAPDEALRVEISEKLGQQTTCKVYRHGRLLFSGRDWSDHAAPTPPTVAPSDLPVATGDAARCDVHGEWQSWIRPFPGYVREAGCSCDIREPRPLKDFAHPAPVHADDTDAGDEGVRLRDALHAALNACCCDRGPTSDGPDRDCPIDGDEYAATDVVLAVLAERETP